MNQEGLMKKTLFGTIFTFALMLATSCNADDENICTDRPGKATSSCTVPSEHFQIESDIYSGTFNRNPSSTSATIADATIKYGLLNNLDIEFTLSPYNYSRHDNDHSVSGFGDVYAKVKYHFYHSTSLDVAIIPVIKIPTAHSILGNGNWEGAIQLPINYQIIGPWSLTTTPEIDFVKNSDNRGTHLALQQAVSINNAVSKTVTISGEVWTSQDFDRVVTRQYSADVSIAWQQSPTLQFDFGINFGLNSATPATQFYLGISKRF